MDSERLFSAPKIQETATFGKKRKEVRLLRSRCMVRSLFPLTLGCFVVEVQLHFDFLTKDCKVYPVGQPIRFLGERISRGEMCTAL